jgi:GntR family transcriptional regulator
MLWTVDASAREPLGEQIAACVRRALVDGGLVPGERLPPARELAATLRVNVNTVLQAYRVLRDEGVLEFRRGRGVRVHTDATARGDVVEAVRALLAAGRRHGYAPAELAALVEELA